MNREHPVEFTPLKKGGGHLQTTNMVIESSNHWDSNREHTESNSEQEESIMNRKVLTIVIAAAAAAWLSGCADGLGPTEGKVDVDAYNSSGAAAYENQMAKDVAREVAEIAQHTGTTNGMAKSAASDGGDLSLQWEHWHYADGWWSRSGSIEGQDAEGNSVVIEGADSVRYRLADQALQQPVLQPGLAADARRHSKFHAVALPSGEALLAADYALNAEVTADGEDTLLTLNGSAQGLIRARSRDGETSVRIDGDITVDGVKCLRTAGKWSRPYEGRVSINSPYKSVDITYNGATAEVVINGNAVEIRTRTVQVQIEDK
jgi:hypothetical protein